MKSVQTYSVVVGNADCNAHCPFCISRMTPKNGAGALASYDVTSNMVKGARLARDMGATTALITGKGEPTLELSKLTNIIEMLNEFFPIIELQTNGINFLVNNEFPEFMSRNNGQVYLPEYKKFGLTTVCLSIVHYKQEFNQKIYSDKYPDLKELVDLIHSYGLSVRLSCMLLVDYIDENTDVKKLIQFCKKNKVEQLTLRNISSPQKPSENESVFEWVTKHRLSETRERLVTGFIRNRGTLLNGLVHGGKVYDYDGQNVCLANCLTESVPESDEIRQFIYFPDDHVRYSWQYEGAILF